MNLIDRDNYAKKWSPGGTIGVYEYFRNWVWAPIIRQGPSTSVLD
jgi:hypothetical protein